MEESDKLLKDVEEELKLLGEQYPDNMQGFGSFMQAVEKDGALKHKDKEIIAVALAVVTRCKWCIPFHVKKSLEAGASKGEIMEAAWVAALMGGGPALMYIQLVINALDDFGA